MPGLSVESLLRGSVSIQDKRGRGTRSRPSYSNSPYSGQKKHQRSTYGAEKLSTEKQWVQNHNSSQPAASFTANQEIDSPPPAYTETAKVSLPTPTPRPISRLSAPQVQPINTLPRLQYPVIIPQNPREGGFCRVYAPLLKECNVSESAFFYFLDDFDRSAEASPWFSAVNIASIGSLNRPHSTAMIVAIARKRINTFLDTVNASFFQPRGLFALLVTWRPDMHAAHEEVNIEEPVFSSSMRTLPFPETAPLIFPSGDRTEKFEPQPMRDLPIPHGMYGPGPTSPVFGRGGGIPRLNGGMGMMGQGFGMGGGGGRMSMGLGGGAARMGMGGFGGMGMGGLGGGRGGFGGLGGPIGLVASLLEDKCTGKYAQRPNQGYYGSSNAGYGYGANEAGYNNGLMGRGAQFDSFGGSDTGAFKKDAVYLMIVKMPSDDEIARFGASS